VDRIKTGYITTVDSNMDRKQVYYNQNRNTKIAVKRFLMLSGVTQRP
jgi:hypothetical protein